MPSDRELMEALVRGLSDPVMRAEIERLAESYKEDPTVNDEHCCLCGKPIRNVHELNNPWPLVGDGSGSCCPECNQSVVQARIWMHTLAGAECERMTALTEKRFKEIREKGQEEEVKE